MQAIWIWSYIDTSLVYPASTYAAPQHQGRLFWIICKRLKVRRKAGRLQLIQNLVPSVALGRQCCIRISKYVIKSLCNYLNISFWWGHDSCLLSSLDKSQFIGLANPITGHQQLDNLQMTILCRIYQGRLVTVIHRIDISLMIKDTRLLSCLTSWCLLQT